MKLALVHRKLTRAGGVEKNVVLLAEGLVARGHEVHVFCAESDAQITGATIRKVPVLKLGQAAKYLSFAKNAAAMVGREPFDVVQGFDLTYKQDVLRIGRGLIRVYRSLIAETRNPFDRLWRFVSPGARATAALERRMLAKGSWKRIVAISKSIARELETAYSIPRDAIEVIYNGVDLRAFTREKAAEGREAARARLGVSREDKVVLFVGTGFRRKGLDLLLVAFARLAMSDPRVKLLIVGRDGGANSYRSLSRKLGIGDRVVFAGRQTADAALYGAGDVLALPTRYEPFGNVVLEALACGVPPVTSAAAGASEVLEEEELHDLIVPDPQDAGRMAEILGTTIAHAVPLADACRRVAERYSEEACVSRYESLYKRLLAKRPEHSGEWKTVG